MRHYIGITVVETVIVTFVVVVWAFGTGLLRWPVGVWPLIPDHRLPDPDLPAEVQLPEVPGAQSRGETPEYRIFLTVNKQGQMLLAPEDQFKSVDGDVIDTLDNPRQVELFLKRRARDERGAFTDEKQDIPLRSPSFFAWTRIVRSRRPTPLRRRPGSPGSRNTSGG
jgi:hypothetical protein